LKEALAKAGIRLHISPGDVITVKDKDVKFPLSLLRTPHERRFCIILSNDFLCETSPILSIIPLSHQIDLMSSCDLRIDKTAENGLEAHSYAVMEQIQPIQRSSVKERKGRLSMNDWDRLAEQMLRNFERA
jgi:mRNA-degrading endonuclease toxin of MazEF toxin-antitoxin module